MRGIHAVAVDGLRLALRIVALAVAVGAAVLVDGGEGERGESIGAGCDPYGGAVSRSGSCRSDLGPVLVADEADARRAL